jgi:hypothetical protein
VQSRWQEIDEALVQLARSDAQLKLRIGELLDALFERDGHHELGFSSFEAYVVERCQRSRSWGRQTRGLARRIRQQRLLKVRRAILEGRLGTSMAEVITRRATPENEGALLEQALACTVREMRIALGEDTTQEPEQGDPDSPRMERTVWVRGGEIAMVAASRVLVEYINGARASDDALMTALLGEAETTLQSIAEHRGAPLRSLDLQSLDAVAASLQALPRTMSRSESPSRPAPAAPVEDHPLPSSLRGLDAEIVRCGQELARRDLEMARLLGTFFAAKAWRALGYGGAGEYAVERMGLSLSSLEHRLTLGGRTKRYPQIARAIEEGSIGYEAAMIVCRVLGRWAGDAIIAAWIERARRRTVKHLREEVAAVLAAIDLDSSTSRLPPSEDDLEAAFAFERKVQTGELLRSHVLSSPRPPQMFVTLISAPEARSGTRRPLQLSISPEVFSHWRVVEHQFRDLAGADASFVAFMCTSLWETWVPFVSAWADKWKNVYNRDRHRCTSPVCERRDVTPHHVRFQAHGGGDEPDNVTSSCAWCHLEGIHRGRLRAQGSADRLDWSIGRDPILEVAGRGKLASHRAREPQS